MRLVRRKDVVFVRNNEGRTTDEHRPEGLFQVVETLNGKPFDTLRTSLQDVFPNVGGVTTSLIL
jgi:hypothetical protein